VPAGQAGRTGEAALSTGAVARFWEGVRCSSKFQTVDVFTSDRFAGNPRAVVLNAEGLSTQQMQAIAAEFNLAETTFIPPPQGTAHTAEVLIFTPRSEMPFAGHPNIGTAFVLARAGTSDGRKVNTDRVMFEE
jgi:trans-2,3-dihydro-3-hydroxyanthranilate isomerase